MTAINILEIFFARATAYVNQMRKTPHGLFGHERIMTLSGSKRFHTFDRATLCADREVDGEAKCLCKPGFREVPGHGCMDDSAPALKLRGPAELTMKQCEKYVERGVEVMDSNSENDDRYRIAGLGTCPVTR